MKHLVTPIHPGKNIALVSIVIIFFYIFPFLNLLGTPSIIFYFICMFFSFFFKFTYLPSFLLIKYDIDLFVI